MKFLATIRTVGGSLGISIPHEVITKLGLKKFRLMEFEIIEEDKEAKTK